MPSRLRPLSALALSVLLPASSAFAFDAPLSDEAVREAYFLGQRQDEKLPRFLDQYRHYLRPSKTLSYVNYVQIWTPFVEAVAVSHQHGMGYSAQQSCVDYRARTNSLHVGVQVNFIAGSTTVDRGNFIVYLQQNGQTIPSSPRRYEVLTQGAGHSGYHTIGYIIWLDYDTESLSSSDATVLVDTPDGQHLSVPFDLSVLR